MSEVKVNKITPTTNCGTVTLGDSGDTIAIPAGVNLTSGGALTNSGTITNTGSITGVTITGTIDNQVNWQTDSIKTTGFTAVAGEGYFCNTTSAAFTVTLPASPSAGDLVGIKDYANTADTNNITIGRNGSNIEGVANDFVINIEGGSITLIYVDATKGWLSTAAAKASDISEQATFITATGGTETTCGDYKTHIFTGPGTFCVSGVGNGPSNPLGGPDVVDYLVVAGGAGGNGAGGFRLSNCATRSGLPAPTMSPLSTTTGITVTATGYPISVGGGGSPVPAGGTKGSNSSGLGIASAGGGLWVNICFPGSQDGGSGGGGGAYVGWGPQIRSAGSGNSPPVSPSQGNPGANVSGLAGPGGADIVAGGGGGAGAAAPGPISVSTGPGALSPNADGGIGSYISNSFLGPTAPSYGTSGPVGSTRYFAGGGAGFSQVGAAFVEGGVGGAGGGGNACSPSGTSGATNTGGGGAVDYATSGTGGGSGIVIIRYKFQ
jgi:hypothetical protein